MPRKKKAVAPPTLPPPAPVRPIKCAFCQRVSSPPHDDVTFIGIGNWRNGPGFFHAVCSTKTSDGQDNPCFLKGMSWATNPAKQKPVCMTYDEWKARPVRRHIIATRAANGRYDLHLNESHLNCYFVLEDKHAPNAEKAKEIVLQWKSAWSLESNEIPDIDTQEREALRKLHANEVLSQVRNEPPAAQPVPLPSELSEELHRHFEKGTKHFIAHILEGGDNCKSCRIRRGMRKLVVIREFVPMVQQAVEMMQAIGESPSVSLFMGDVRKFYDDNVKTICRELDLDPNDPAGNELALRRNARDIQAVIALFGKYGIKV